MNLDDDMCYLGMEMQMGMRVQSMGRDQNEMVDKMRALPQELIRYYWETDYVTRVGDTNVVVRIPDPVPPELASHRWSIITAHNPYSASLTAAENKHRRDLLANLLKLHGYETLPAAGRSGDGQWEEPSILVFNISFELAKAFGSCFQQNAVVFAEACGPVELVFCDR